MAHPGVFEGFCLSFRSKALKSLAEFKSLSCLWRSPQTHSLRSLDYLRFVQANVFPSFPSFYASASK